MVRMKWIANSVAVCAICLATLAAGPTTHPTTRIATSQPTTLPSRLSFNFKDVPLDTILNVLSQAAGFEILTDGPVDGRVTILSKQPVTPEEAVTMLNAALKANGFTVIREGKMLRISARDKAKKGNLPVHFGADPADVADTEELITQVIPIQNLSAGKLKDDLKPMMAADVDIAANDGSNTIIITDASSSIRRLVQIISQLDQHEATTSELRIIPLKHANATATAKLLDAFFKGPAAQAPNQNGRQMFQQQGQQGPPAPDNSSQRHGQTVMTAADDRTNTLLVMASIDQLKLVDAIISQIDSDNLNPAPLSTMKAFVLKYADADTTAKMINNIFKPSKEPESIEDIIFGNRDRDEDKSKIEVNAVSDDRTNTVIVTAPQITLDAVAGLIAKLDTSPTVTQDIRVIHLRYADASDVADVITDMFKPKDKSSDNGFPFLIFSDSPPPKQAKGVTINVTSDERTNTVLVTAPIGLLDNIEKIVRQLDADPTSEDTMFIYHLRNGQAQHLEYTLNVLFGNISSQGNNQQNGQQQQNQGLQNQQNQNQNGNSLSNNSSSTNNQSTTAKNNRNNKNNQNNRPGAGGIAQATSDFTGHVLVVAEPDTNSLLITTASKYEPMVRRIIDDLDHPVQQVLIKVLIAEVSHDNTDDLGLDFSVLNLRPSGNGTEGGTTFGSPTNGLIVNVLESNVTATLHALATRGKLDVLSRPYILASDNQEATITVGQSVPYVSNVQFNDTNNPISTVLYRDIGVILDVTPHINPDGLVILDVTPEISSMTDSLINLTPGVSSPVFQTRNASSRVNIQDGQTIVIGGLMQDQNTTTLQKVPVLGDIPGLGLLFQRNQVEKTKTELLIFMTPHVAQMPQKLAPMTNDEEKGLRLTPDAIGPGVFQEHMNGMERGGFPQTQPVQPTSPVDSIEENNPTTQP